MKTSYKTLSFLGIIALSFSPLFSFALSDIQNYSFKNSVEILLKSNIIRGYDDGSFRPQQKMNRAEFSKIVVTASLNRKGSPLPPAKTCFPDVRTSNWFSPYVCYAKENNIIKGYPNGRFYPEKEINQAEALKILGELFYNNEIRNIVESAIWYEKYMRLFAGKTQTFTAGPSHALSRGEMAYFVAKILDENNPDTIPTNYNSDSQENDFSDNEENSQAVNTNNDPNENDDEGLPGVGKSETWEAVVDSKRYACEGVSPMQCLKVDGELFYETIKGFSFVPGYYYRIQIKATQVYTPQNVPEDADLFRYNLVKIIEKKTTPIQVTYQDEGADDQNYADNDEEDSEWGNSNTSTTTTPTASSSLLPTGLTSALEPQVTTTNPLWKRLPSPSLIKRNTQTLPASYRGFSKYINYKTPNGGKILLVGQNRISDEQLLRAWNLLDFYLTNVPGKKYGTNRAAIANQMAKNGATLAMPNGADGETQLNVPAQPLYEKEFPVEGSADYINNNYDTRDAGFEEIFHMVHDNGIGSKNTNGVLKNTFQREITAAMENSLKKNLWGREAQDWLAELRQEGSLEQEYIASVLDSFYGYWGAFKKKPGGMWGMYVAKTRKEIAPKDPMGAKLMANFFPDYLTYVARIAPEFTGTFEMSFSTAKPYTYKSQYLASVRLLGKNNTNVSGNSANNFFVGNAGNNFFDGKAGTDVLQIYGKYADYTITKSGTKTLIKNKKTNETDSVQSVEILRFTDKDHRL